MDPYFDEHALWRWVLVVAMVMGLTIAIGLIAARVLGRAERKHLAPTAGLFATDTESEAGHVVMLAAMIAMTLTSEADVSMLAWRWVFGALGISYAILLVARVARWLGEDARPFTAERASGAVYHLVASLAMLYATLGHAAAHAMHGMTSRDGPPAPALGWAAIVLFGIDGAFTVLVALTRRLPDKADRLPQQVRLVLAPHAVMDVAMIAMLVAVL